MSRAFYMDVHVAQTAIESEMRGQVIYLPL